MALQSDLDTTRMLGALLGGTESDAALAAHGRPARAEVALHPARQSAWERYAGASAAVRLPLSCCRCLRADAASAPAAAAGAGSAGGKGIAVAAAAAAGALVHSMHLCLAPCIQMRSLNNVSEVG